MLGNQRLQEIVSLGLYVANIVSFINDQQVKVASEKSMVVLLKNVEVDDDDVSVRQCRPLGHTNRSVIYKPLAKLIAPIDLQ